MKINLCAWAICLLQTMSLVNGSLMAQDTTTVQTLTWDSTSRSGYYQFPDIPADQVERINMVYNMRCQDAKVGNNGVGCGEWDYSCNTFITDTNRLDSVLAIQRKFVIPNFSGTEFYYALNPTKNCLSYTQKMATHSGIVNEFNGVVGTTDRSHGWTTENGKYFYLFTAAEMRAANLKAGKIHAIKWLIIQGGHELPFLKLRMKQTAESTLSPLGVDVENLTEVYFSNTSFINTGLQTLLFYNPFTWDGASNVLLEVSFNAAPGQPSLNLSSSQRNQMAITSTGSNFHLYQNGAGGFSLDSQKLSTLSDEVSISFWAFGDLELLPNNTTVFEGVDAANNRQLNVHLPWSNGSIYWDCGNDGAGYDRIEKPANSKDFEGQWVHWTFTKNAITGKMNIYRNGSLWHSGTGKTKKIHVERMKFASSIDESLFYPGRLAQFCIWKKELDSNTIKRYIFNPGDASHPERAFLVYHLPLNDRAANQITDLSANPVSIPTSFPLQWVEERGRNLLSGFVALDARPVTTFVQGTLTLTIANVPVLEEFGTYQLPVKEYAIEKNKPVLKNTSYLYPAGDFIIRNENGDPVDFKVVDHDGILVMEDLKYQNYSPAKYELLSLVTPYGNGLDLTKDGKTFVFDVTDYAPVLRGNKFLSVEFGAYQEELDVKFQFIRGKASREVKDIQNVYQFQRGYLGSILNDVVFEPRNIRLHPEARFYKIRTTVTGHEQNGEFVSRSHYVRVNGNKGTKKFDFTVWKECADNPIYPQGGTWIFDRAGWCPGAASDVHSFDISSLVDPNANMVVDYGVNGGIMDAANYLVSCQLVSYGAYQYAVDAGIENIIRPNGDRVEYERFNPSCSKPMVVVKNFGSAPITSVKLKYQVTGGNALEYNFQGNIAPNSAQQIDLPVDQVGFWSGAQQQFEVRILEVNGTIDENPRNNLMLSNFKLVRTFDYDPIFEIRTNGVAGDNGYRVRDMNGNIILEKRNLPANTTTQENLVLPNGCYSLEVDDLAQDGLYFWYYPNFGNGSVSIKRKVNNNIIPAVSFKSDFGAGFRYDFIVQKVTSTDDNDRAMRIGIYPNPSTDVVYLDIAGEIHREAFIQLVDAAGTIIMKQFLAVGDQQRPKPIQIGDLPKGIYFVQLRSGHDQLVRKLIIE